MKGKKQNGGKVFFSDEEALELCANYLLVNDHSRFISLYPGLKDDLVAREEMVGIVVSLFTERGHEVERIAGGGIAVVKKT